MNGDGFGRRLVLLAYPRCFRRDFGDEMLRSITDLRRHSGISRRRLAVQIAADVVRTAPTMRLESLMSMSRFKPFALALVLAVALMAAAVGSPSFYLFIASAVAVLAIVVRTGDRPIVTDPEQTAHWYRWCGAAAGFFAVGFVILIIDGNELTSVGWTIWALSWAIGVVLGSFGLVLVGSRALRRVH